MHRNDAAQAHLAQHSKMAGRRADISRKRADEDVPNIAHVGQGMTASEMAKPSNVGSMSGGLSHASGTTNAIMTGGINGPYTAAGEPKIGNTAGSGGGTPAFSTGKD